MKTFLIFVVIGAVCIAALVLLAHAGDATSARPQNRADAVDAACEENFGRDGADAINRCRLAGYERIMDNDQRRKFEAVERAAQ